MDKDHENHKDKKKIREIANDFRLEYKHYIAPIVYRNEEGWLQIHAQLPMCYAFECNAQFTLKDLEENLDQQDSKVLQEDLKLLKREMKKYENLGRQLWEQLYPKEAPVSTKTFVIICETSHLSYCLIRAITFGYLMELIHTKDYSGQYTEMRQHFFQELPKPSKDLLTKVTHLFINDWEWKWYYSERIRSYIKKLYPKDALNISMVDENNIAKHIQEIQKVLRINVELYTDLWGVRDTLLLRILDAPSQTTFVPLNTSCMKLTIKKEESQTKYEISISLDSGQCYKFNEEDFQLVDPSEGGARTVNILGNLHMNYFAYNKGETVVEPGTRICIMRCRCNHSLTKQDLDDRILKGYVWMLADGNLETVCTICKENCDIKPFDLSLLDIEAKKKYDTMDIYTVANCEDYDYQY